MAAKTKIAAALIIIFSLMFFSGCGEKPIAYQIDLEIWGIFDNSDAYGAVLNKYREFNPFVNEIVYRKMDIDTYKDDLLNALASGQGPDIFYVHNTWLTQFGDKIEPAPDWMWNEREFRENFVDVAADDFLAGGRIYAAPLSVDSLALYYNKDLLNAEGITSPPATWEELENAVKKLTKINQFGEITQQGVAMGTAYNINRSTDILGLLMFQKDTEMIDERRGSVNFSNPVINTEGKTVKAGEEALEFYTRFASSSSPVYSWNPRMDYSIDAFFENTTAMMINYSWQYETIRSKNSKLNFAVSEAPQFSGIQPVNYANYWALAVAKNKTISSQDDRAEDVQPVDNTVRIYEAWELLKFLTLKNNGSFTLTNGFSGNTKDVAVDIDPAVEYLKVTRKPAARRDIIEQQKNDPILGPFAYGNLIAKSWRQPDPEAVETIFADMINSINTGTDTIYDALKLANTRVDQLIRR